MLRLNINYLTDICYICHIQDSIPVFLNNPVCVVSVTEHNGFASCCYKQNSRPATREYLNKLKPCIKSVFIKRDGKRASQSCFHVIAHRDQCYRLGRGGQIKLIRVTFIDTHKVKATLKTCPCLAINIYSLQFPHTTNSPFAVVVAKSRNNASLIHPVIFHTVDVSTADGEECLLFVYPAKSASVMTSQSVHQHQVRFVVFPLRHVLTLYPLLRCLWRCCDLMCYKNECNRKFENIHVVVRRV